MGPHIAPGGSKHAHRQWITVDEHLRLISYPHIFALGDINLVNTINEIKLAHTAELHAEYASEHFIHTLTSSPLQTKAFTPYHRWLLGDSWKSNRMTILKNRVMSCARSRKTEEKEADNSGIELGFAVIKPSVPPIAYAISLGPYDGSLQLYGFVFSGFLAAFSKWFICWSKCKAMLHGSSQKIGFNVKVGKKSVFCGFEVYSLGYRVSKLIWFVADSLHLIVRRHFQ